MAGKTLPPSAQQDEHVVDLKLFSAPHPLTKIKFRAKVYPNRYHQIWHHDNRPVDGFSFFILDQEVNRILAEAIPYVGLMALLMLGFVSINGISLSDGRRSKFWEVVAWNFMNYI